MFSLHPLAPADGFDQDSSCYEWAEYNLPAAPDMAVLREYNEKHAGREALWPALDATIAATV
jgi:hypothetical protein